jgi:NAD(P)-dependent dehydrogenase (short-subunit alcohol dehydrogenase family)
MPAPISLAGVSVAVTGAGRGTGRAIAIRLASAGARVTVGDIDHDAAQAVADGLGDAAIAVSLDVTQPEQFAAFLDAGGQQHGPLGVLVNNAGVDWIGPFHEEPDEVTHREIEINLYGTALGTKLAPSRMLPRHHGHIVKRRVGSRTRPPARHVDVLGFETRGRRADRIAAP